MTKVGYGLACHAYFAANRIAGRLMQVPELLDRS
jgi:hypothetical protein